MAAMDRDSAVSLPTELLSKIFLEGTEAWRTQEPGAAPFPAIVSGVCTRWRRVSKGLPELWTYILPPLHKESAECLDWTALWLERSDTLLVSVVLDDLLVTQDIEGELSSLTERKIAKILNLLSRHSRRLRRLDIRSATIGGFKKFIRDLWDAPYLEQLSLCARKDYTNGFLFKDGDERSAKWSALQNLPSLKRFRFRKICPPLLSNLTSLTAYRLLVNYDGIKALFSSATHLAHLVLHELPPYGFTYGSGNLAPIPALSLRSIAVEPTTQFLRDNTSIFSYMDIPNLEHLEIQGQATSHENLFGRSLTKSFERIKKLRLARLTDLRDNVGFFQSFCNLEELEIIHAPSTALFPLEDESGMQRTSSQSIWAQLRSITLDSQDLNDLTALVKFIERRLDHQTLEVNLSKGSLRLLETGDLYEASEDHMPLRSKFGNKVGREWLNRFVELSLFETPSYGLLDADRVPLAEMP